MKTLNFQRKTNRIFLHGIGRRRQFLPKCVGEILTGLQLTQGHIGLSQTNLECLFIHPLENQQLQRLVEVLPLFFWIRPHHDLLLGTWPLIFKLLIRPRNGEDFEEKLLVESGIPASALVPGLHVVSAHARQRTVGLPAASPALVFDQSKPYEGGEDNRKQVMMMIQWIAGQIPCPDQVHGEEVLFGCVAEGQMDAARVWSFLCQIVQLFESGALRC